MARPEFGASVRYRDGAEYLPATVFDITADPAYAGHIHGHAPAGEGLNLRVELPDGRTADRVHVPHSDENGGWIEPAKEDGDGRTTRTRR